MQIKKKNFILAKTLKALGNPESDNYALHVTRDRTEITNGSFAIQMRHSEQQEFEFEPGYPLDVLLSVDDAANIAATIGKGFVKEVIPADDGKTVHVEFESGEIRILPLRECKYATIDSAVPHGRPGFSVAFSAPSLIAVLEAFISAGEGYVVFEFRDNRTTVVVRSATDGREDPAVRAVISPASAHGLVNLPGARASRNANGSEEQQGFPLQ